MFWCGFRTCRKWITTGGEFAEYIPAISGIGGGYLIRELGGRDA
jgi:hypothetical protein